MPWSAFLLDTLQSRLTSRQYENSNVQALYLDGRLRLGHAANIRKLELLRDADMFKFYRARVSDDTILETNQYYIKIAKRACRFCLF